MTQAAPVEPRMPGRARRWAASLRGRLILATVALLAGGLLIADLTASWALADHLRDRTQRNLDRAIEQLDRASQGPTVTLAPGWAQSLVLPSTVIVARSPEGVQLISTVPEGVAVDATGAPVDGYLTRTWTPRQPVTVDSPSGRLDVGSITVGVSLADDRETLRTLLWVEAVAGVLIVVVGVLAGWMLLQGALRPLRHIAGAAVRIESGADEPIPAGPPGSETHDLATALDRAFATRARSEAAARQFLADASHELRTPVTAIRGWADLYLQGALPEPADVDEAMASIAAESARISSLVEQMLTLARLDAGVHGGVDRPADTVDLAAVARDTCRAVRPLLDDRLGRLRCNAPNADDGRPPTTIVVGDGAALRRLVDNLVVNAVRHAGPDARIDVRVFADAHQVHVSVADTGPGLSEVDRARAFDRFWSGDRGRGRRGGGTGLGLAIVREIARSYGGDVVLAANRPHGLVATLTLPGGSGPAVDSQRIVRSGEAPRSGRRDGLSSMTGEVVDQYLQRIEFADDDYAELIRLPGYQAATVVVDPTRGFGQPIFCDGGSRVEDALSMYWAGESLADVAAEHGVPEPQLEDALRVAT